MAANLAFILQGKTMKIQLFAIALFPLLSWAGEKIDETLAIPTDGKVIIENQRGEVIIKGWEQSSFKVTGELDDKAEGYKLKSSGNRTIFKVDMPNRISSWNSGDGSDLVIYMPLNSELNFNGVNVNVDIEDIKGGADIETVNGKITAKELTGKINLETVNGDIKSTNLTGKIQFNTVNGDIDDTGSSGQLRFTAVNGKIASVTQAERINIENVNGEISLDIAKLQNLDISTVNGEIELKIKSLLDLARIDLESVSGRAELILPKDVSAKFEIESHAGGRIKNKLTNDTVNKAKYGPSSRLEFETNGGNADIEIDTISGRITIKHD